MKNLLLALTIASTGAAALPGADAIPLEMGNYWTYQHQMTGESFTIRVGQPIWTQSGKRFHYLSGYTASAVVARIDEDGNLVALDPDNGMEHLLTGFARRPGDLWDAPKRDCPLQGQVLTERKPLSILGGTWNRTLGVQYHPLACADTGITGEVFAENVGMLRRVVTTFSGPKSFDLVYARIGSQSIETTDRARFSVSLSSSPDKATLRATLRVDIGYQPVVRLRFGSSQEFDLAVRDGVGKIVWQWSEGRLFDPGEREKELGNVWTETVDIPRPSGDLSGYTIEGWLTTAPGTAKFAATISVSPTLVRAAP